VLQGHGELDINNAGPPQQVGFNEPLSGEGMANLVERLKKDEFEVQGLRFIPRGRKEENVILAPESGPDKKKQIPEDAYAVIIAGATEPIPKEALDALESYVDRGGRLLAFFDTIYDQKYKKMRLSGLEDFLRKYGVDVRPEVVVFRNKDPRLVLWETPERPQTLLARQFAKTTSTLFGVRPVKPLPSAGRFKADVFWELNDKRYDFWAEESPLPIANIQLYFQQNMRSNQQIAAKAMHEPLPIAVTVTEGSADLAKPRMVVFGDVDFIMNDDRMLGAYYEVVSSSLEWMAERGGYIGPRPREVGTYAAPKDADRARLFVYPLLLMLLCIAGLGTGLWLVRRR
jgi:hypothetical protein